jgi:putative tryptophan/tyrosine transport system substrate-binding protein
VSLNGFIYRKDGASAHCPRQFANAAEGHVFKTLERFFATLGDAASLGAIQLPGSIMAFHRKLIIGLAIEHRLPMVYGLRDNPVNGGLASYGVNSVDLYRQSASYVDRILKGEVPKDLPVQAADRYELVINLKSAKAIGLELPPALLARADEVIE